jgi:hypothetical protein
VVVAAAAVTGPAWLLVLGFTGHGLKDLWQLATPEGRRRTCQHPTIAAQRRFNSPAKRARAQITRV